MNFYGRTRDRLGFGGADDLDGNMDMGDPRMGLGVEEKINSSDEEIMLGLKLMDKFLGNF